MPGSQPLPLPAPEPFFLPRHAVFSVTAGVDIPLRVCLVGKLPSSVMTSFCPIFLIGKATFSDGMEPLVTEPFSESKAKSPPVSRAETSLACLFLAPLCRFSRYYINLCQRIYKGPLGCSERASICRRSTTGDVQVLGLVHTQKLDVIGKACGSWSLVQGAASEPGR